MSSPINEIKALVSESRTRDALSRLLELSQSNKQTHHAILILSGEFNDLTSHRLKGTIDNSEATRRLNVIHDKILIALGAFDSGGRVLPRSMVGKKRASAAGMLGRITLLFGGLGIMMLIMAKGFSREDKVINGLIKVGKKWTESIFFEIGSASLFLGFLVFIAYLLAMVVSAFKK